MQKTEDDKRVVIVIDEKGNKYESTYPKRARGLIKSGRARLVNDNTICLLCPSNHQTEDKKMNNNEHKLDINYILRKIDEIIEQGKNLHDVTDEHIELMLAREDTNQEMISFFTRNI